MSLTFSQTQGNGVTLSYPIVAESGFFEDEDIVVELIGVEDGSIVEQVQDTDYTISDNNVIFTVAPTSDYYVRIRRVANNESTYSDFTRGNAFGATNLNNSFLHSLYQIQQLADGFRPDDFYWKGDTNAGNKKLTNLADGEDSGDAVNVGQVEELIEAIDMTSEYADQAEASADAAAASAADALVSKNAASASAVQADAYADAAELSATNAANAESNASTYASNANTAATNALSSANASSSSASSASGYASAANASAGAASTSATSASNSATSASNSASSASSSASSASGSATAASNSAIDAAESAEALDNFAIANVVEFGATGDGVTDDTSAIQDAIDSLSSTGGIVFFPPGVYVTSSALEVLSNGITLKGSGTDATKLYPNTATDNIIEIGSYTTGVNGCNVYDIQITSSIVKTAGAAIKVVNSHQVNLDRIVLGSNMYVGFQFEAGDDQYLYYLHHFEINSGAFGILVGEDFSEGGIVQGLYVSDGNIANTTGSGIRLLHASGCFFRTIDILSCYRGVTVAPFESTSGRVVACWLDTVICDTCTDQGWYFAPGSTTGLIQEITMIGCWGASCGTHGLHIDNTQAADLVSGIIISDGRFINNNAHGMIISNLVESISVCNTQSMGNGKGTTNTYSGLYLGDGIDGVTVTGGVFGDGGLFSNDQAYGIKFAGTCSEISLVNVNVTGNLTKGIDDSTVGSGNQLKITSCRGHSTEDSGTATITAGNSSVTVSHGLASTPDLHDISLVHATDPNLSVTGGFFTWITNITSTTFDINASASMTAQCWIYWKAQTR